VASQVDMLLQHGIKFVINVCDMDHGSLTKHAYIKNDINYIWLNTEETDEVNIINRGQEVSELIRNYTDGDAGGILVHCWEGVNRSTACLCVHLIHEYGIPLTDAFKLIYSVRIIVDIMDSFWIQLKDYSLNTASSC
jgi:protein-tyrosine phosphatase